MIPIPALTFDSVALSRLFDLQEGQWSLCLFFSAAEGRGVGFVLYAGERSSVPQKGQRPLYGLTIESQLGQVMDSPPAGLLGAALSPVPQKGQKV